MRIKMTPIIIWGAAGQAIVLEEFIKENELELVAVFDNKEELITPFPNIPIHYGKNGFLNWLKTCSFKSPELKCAIAIGGRHGKIREEIGSFLESSGLTSINLIHPSAYVARNSTFGKGIQVLAQATICTGVIISDYCIINTSAIVDHESILGNGVHIGPGAILAGCVEVDDYSFVGMGATILPRIKIGKNSIVGAGSVVTKNVPDNVIVYGNPARFIREND